jgi:hypothetical protein
MILQHTQTPTLLKQPGHICAATPGAGRREGGFTIYLKTAGKCDRIMTLVIQLTQAQLVASLTQLPG